jgi:hypothetical protein
MARLQILQLPAGAGDDRPSFVLVVDETVPQRVVLGPDVPYRDYWQDIAQQIGARAVIVTPETVEIPANDTTAPTDEAFKGEVQEWAAGTNKTLAHIIDAVSGKKWRPANDGQRLADERTDIARSMDRLANRKNELLEALGMDHTRDWDDIRNAAAGLRKQRDAQGAAIEHVRQLHKPVIHRNQEICWECSAYDFLGQSTDKPPVAYNQCGTRRVLTADSADEPTVKP